MLRLIVEILTGELFYIEVEDNATVEDLKKEIEAQENLPHDRLILMFESSLLIHLTNGNDISLVDYGIGDGSHLYLFLAPLDDGLNHHFLPTSQDSSVFSHLPNKPSDRKCI